MTRKYKVCGYCNHPTYVRAWWGLNKYNELIEGFKQMVKKRKAKTQTIEKLMLEIDREIHQFYKHYKLINLYHTELKYRLEKAGLISNYELVRTSRKIPRKKSE